MLASSRSKRHEEQSPRATVCSVLVRQIGCAGALHARTSEIKRPNSGLNAIKKEVEGLRGEHLHPIATRHTANHTDGGNRTRVDPLPHKGAGLP